MWKRFHNVLRSRHRKRLENFGKDAPSGDAKARPQNTEIRDTTLEVGIDLSCRKKSDLWRMI